MENENKAGVIKITGLGGGLGQISRSRSALRVALAAAAGAGAETQLLDLENLDLPFFVPDIRAEDYPEAAIIKSFLETIQYSDGLIWSSPVYHGTISAAFKNALDFLELLPRRPDLYLEGKVVGMITVASGQYSAPQALTALWHSARALKALVATNSLPVPNGKQFFDQQGNLLDERIKSQLNLLGREVVELSKLYRNMPRLDRKRK